MSPVHISHIFHAPFYLVTPVPAAWHPDVVGQRLFEFMYVQ